MWMFVFSSPKAEEELSQMTSQSYNIPACPLGSLLSVLWENGK